MYGIIDPTIATPLDARKKAEEAIAPILDWPKEQQALAAHILHKAGWTRTAWEAELRRAKWWL